MLGQSLVVIDVVFLVVGMPSIVPARLRFQDMIFGDMTSMLSFIARGWLHYFADFILSPLPSLFSNLVAAFIAARISGGSSFHYVCLSWFG